MMEALSVDPAKIIVEKLGGLSFEIDLAMQLTKAVVLLGFGLTWTVKYFTDLSKIYFNFLKKQLVFVAIWYYIPIVLVIISEKESKN